jgi:hypothetical protein
VTITSGHSVTIDEDGSRNVPKEGVVSVLQVLLQTRRLKINRDLPNAGLLAKEMDNSRVKVTVSANETFEAWREGSMTTWC